VDLRGIGEHRPEVLGKNDADLHVLEEGVIRDLLNIPDDVPDL